MTPGQRPSKALLAEDEALVGHKRFMPVANGAHIITTAHLTTTDDVGTVAQITKAQRMLSEARSIAEFRELRDFSTSLRAWARARGLGVESENEVAEFILRSERGAGKELIRMSEAGERSGRGWPKGVPHDEQGRIPEGPRTWDQGVTLADLGVSNQDASYWMALAVMQDDAFEAAVAEALKPGPDGRVRRLSKMSFYREAGRAKDGLRQRQDDPVAPFEELRAHCEWFLHEGLSQFAPDDVVGVGKLGVRLVKAARSEMDRRGL